MEEFKFYLKSGAILVVKASNLVEALEKVSESIDEIIDFSKGKMCKFLWDMKTQKWTTQLSA